jgi:hypothetical protein
MTTRSAIAFDDLRPLFGRAIDDPMVVAVLARAGMKFGKPKDGASYAVAKKAGFDLLAQAKAGAKRGAPLIVHTAFLFREGQSGHAQFPSPPYGFAFTTRAALLASMPPPKLSWLIGEGAVPVDAPEVSHDAWEIDGLSVSADYDEAGVVRSIDIATIA